MDVRGWFEALAQKLEKIYSKNKRAIKFVAILIVIAIVGLLIWIFIIIPNSQRVSIVAPKQTSANKVTSSIINGDYEGGQKVLNKSLVQTTDPKQQAWIYIQKASVAINLNKFLEAYDFASNAEKLNPDVNSAQMMAAAAAAKGDKADAILKYELAISRISGNSGMDELDKKSMQNKISELRD